MSLPILLDGDPGHDDAIAWTIALASEKLDVLAVTSVAGNQTIEKTTDNAGRILSLLKKNRPLAQGAARPLFGEPLIAPSVHGESGLDGPQLPESRCPLHPLPAHRLMAQKLAAAREPVTIVATGPLTNVATLLLSQPELRPKIREIVFMGGGVGWGNWTAAAEFNILVDPEAADLVFRSGLPLTMCGLDVTEEALILPEEVEAIRRLNNEVAGVVADWVTYFYRFHRALGYPGAPLHDAVAVLYLIAPQIFSGRSLHVEVELAGDWCRGATVADLDGRFGGRPNVQVLLQVDRQAFIGLLLEHVARYAGGQA